MSEYPIIDLAERCTTDRANLSILDILMPNRDSTTADRSAKMNEQIWYNQLTETQKACLRLVATGMSSKEIAIETGLSPRTVDTYLTVAAQTMGVSGRREAARKVGAFEIQLSQNLQSQSQPVDQPPVSVTTDEANPATASGPIGRFIGWVPPLGGRRDKLSASVKIVQTVKAAAIAAVAFGSIVATGAWLQTLFS